MRNGFMNWDIPIYQSIDTNSGHSFILCSYLLIRPIMTLYSLSTLATLVATAIAASLQPVKNFGANPAGLSMNIYVPDNVKPNAAIILSVRSPVSL